MCIPISIYIHVFIYSSRYYLQLIVHVIFSAPNNSPHLPSPNWLRRIASTTLWAGTTLLGAARVPGEFTETQLLPVCFNGVEGKLQETMFIMFFCLTKIYRGVL